MITFFKQQLPFCMLLMCLLLLLTTSMENNHPDFDFPDFDSNSEMKIQPGDYREVIEPFWTFPQTKVEKDLHFKVLDIDGITAKIITNEGLFFMYTDDLIKKTKKYWHFDIIEIIGLTSIKGQELNGKYGIVLNGPMEKSGRYEIYVEDEKNTFALKPENLRWNPETYDAEEDVQFDFPDQDLEMSALSTESRKRSNAASTLLYEIEKPITGIKWFDEKSESEKKNLLAGIISSVKRNDYNCSSPAMKEEMGKLYNLNATQSNDLCRYVVRNEMVPKTKFEKMFIKAYDFLAYVNKKTHTKY